MNRVPKVYIYTDFPSAPLNIQNTLDHLERFGVPAFSRGNFFDFLLLSEESSYRVAELLAASRIHDISAPQDEIGRAAREQALSEIDKITGKKSNLGEFYDGLWLQRIFHKALADKVPDEWGKGFLHVIFTGRLFGTFESRRYHARVLLGGNPALISTSGVVEAPAKPREYYFIKGALIQSGKDTDELDRMYEGRFVEYGDPKITPIICSYALQAVFYEATGAEFCDNPSCCLYNSHWQEEVLKVQLKGRLCGKCLNEFQKLTG
ncbi:MAG: hypothetical protein RIG61_12165 [Deltaproteobacteria bacterium]